MSPCPGPGEDRSAAPGGRLWPLSTDWGQWLCGLLPPASPGLRFPAPLAAGSLGIPGGFFGDKAKARGTRVGRMRHWAAKLDERPPQNPSEIKIEIIL